MGACRSRSATRDRLAAAFHAAVVFLLLLVALGANADEYDPYKIPREQFRSEVAVIALQPVQVVAEIPGRDQIERHLEELARAKLESKGYRVVEPAVVEAKWIETSKTIGGVYDPVTGIADEAKQKTVREYTGRELEREHAADAFLLLRVAYNDMLPWSAGAFSVWKSGDEDLTWEGEGLNGDLLNVPQRVIGAYLNVVIFDLAGEPLYSIRAPLQWTRIYMARSYYDRPPPELFADPERSRKAVDETLGPLLAVDD